MNFLHDCPFKGLGRPSKVFRLDSPLLHAAGRFDSPLYNAAVRFDSPSHHAAESFDSPLHHAVGSQTSIVISPRI